MRLHAGAPRGSPLWWRSICVPFLPHSQRRFIGLSIGNAAYPGTATAFSRLYQPTRDAAAMHAALSGKGFWMLTTVPLANATKRAMRRLFMALKAAVASGDTVVVHFSGHGFVAKDGFYLVPVDAGVWV